MVSGRSGTSLVEVLVALVVLEMGLLAVLGLWVLAAGEVAAAADLQRGVGALSRVADSLLAEGDAGTGVREVGQHLVRWEEAGGRVTVEVTAASSSGPPLHRVTLPWPSDAPQREPTPEPKLP